MGEEETASAGQPLGADFSSWNGLRSSLASAAWEPSWHQGLAFGSCCLVDGSLHSLGLGFGSDA